MPVRSRPGPGLKRTRWLASVSTATRGHGLAGPCLLQPAAARAATPARPSAAARRLIAASQALVRAVAERVLPGLLAAAEPHLLGLLGGELGRREGTALVRA